MASRCQGLPSSLRWLFECLPQIGSFADSGYSVEEEKMINETRKIFGEPQLRVSATTVRVTTPQRPMVPLWAFTDQTCHHRHGP